MDRPSTGVSFDVVENVCNSLRFVGMLSEHEESADHIFAHVKKDLLSEGQDG